MTGETLDSERMQIVEMLHSTSAFTYELLHFSYIAKQCVFFNECLNCLLLKGAFTAASRYISDNYRAEVTASSG